MTPKPDLCRTAWRVHLIFLALAAGIALIAGSWHLRALVTPFYLWLMVPYAAFLLTTRTAHRKEQWRVPAGWAAWVVSFLLLGATSVLYLGGDFSRSSTACIGLVFAPFWLLLGSQVLFAVGLLLGWLAQRCG